jgi:hypothetical protein
MSPIWNQLKKTENKLKHLESIRQSGDDSGIDFSGLFQKLKISTRGTSSDKIDMEIQKTYEEYALLKIRYLMDTL